MGIAQLGERTLWEHEAVGSRPAAHTTLREVTAVAISQYRLKQLISLIQQGREHEFYLWPEWRNEDYGVRKAVLKLDNYDCQE